MAISIQNLVPGRTYRIVNDLTGEQINATFLRTRNIGSFNPELNRIMGRNLHFAVFQRDNGVIFELPHRFSHRTFYNLVNNAIRERNGALTAEHRPFRAQLVAQLGPEEAVQRLANRDPATLQRRKHLLHVLETQGGRRKRRHTRRRSSRKR